MDHIHTMIDELLHSRKDPAPQTQKDVSLNEKFIIQENFHIFSLLFDLLANIGFEECKEGQDNLAKAFKVLFEMIHLFKGEPAVCKPF